MNPPGFWVGRIFPLSMLPQLWHKRKHKIMSGANQLTIDNEQLTIMVSLRDVNSIYWEFRKILRAAPHNGARRFGQCFDPSESMENAGILDVFPIFHTARLGAKDPPKPAAPIVRCCLRNLPVKDYFIHPRRGFLNCQLSIINCRFTKFLFRQQVVNKPGKKPKYALTGKARYAKIS